MNRMIEAVTERIVEGSGATREACLERCRRTAEAGAVRARLSCGNIANVGAADVLIDGRDMAEISSVTTPMARVYPNGIADVNHFQMAGGPGSMIRELLDTGLLDDDVTTVAGRGLRRYATEPKLEDGALVWRGSAAESGSAGILRPVAEPFQPTGGLRLLDGNPGRAVIKTSAVKPEHRVIEAPARVLHSQEEVKAAFKAGELERDMIVVVRFRGPKTNGVPELNSLIPPLGVMLDRGHKVALVSDGRMSRASGKVPAAIHVSPEVADAGPIARIPDGDPARLDTETGRLDVLVDAAEFAAREQARPGRSANRSGIGRELYGAVRAAVGPAATGATVVV